MGREGMSRRHAFYKMVSLVQGTNLVKKELGLPVTESLGADPKYLADSDDVARSVKVQKGSELFERLIRLIHVADPIQGERQ